MSFRSSEEDAIYRKSREENKNRCVFCDLKGEVKIEEYNNWFILKNNFPYTKIAVTHDMLVAKRHISGEEFLTDEERNELFKIKTDMLRKMKYEVMYENLPRQQSIKAHYHVHLLVLKDEFKSFS